ncbi:hypothetical protein H4582DRAFT_617487 [Lactarius indigo]|nr:hypothetical protein H4582DRAFT_617487 [Lactarius indigo]
MPVRWACLLALPLPFSLAHIPPACLKAHCYFSLYATHQVRRRLRRTLLSLGLRLTGACAAGADHTGGPALPCPHLFQSFLSPSRPPFIRAAVGRMEAGRTLVSSGNGKEEGRRNKNRPRFTLRSFTGVGSLLYREHAYSRKSNYEAKMWNGRSRERRVSTLPCTKICTAWFPLATLYSILNTHGKKRRHCVDDSPSSPPLTTM